MKFVRLIPQDKIFFVQTKEMEADNTFRSRVVKQLGGKNITSVSRVAPNRYIVAAKSNTLLGEDYVSNIYRSEGESPIIVLPRIVLMLNTGKRIEPILKRITNISVEETNGVRYVLKCNVSSSERVLAIIDILNGMSEVKWCEPEMLIEKNGATLFIQSNTILRIQGKMEALKV